ncbi:heterocyst frequency control protein PatD [Spirulina sp. 06S082]|uniref:heterocyst frequency control protein PatD n=1 Tax=Spirulina sp. 06S082 TaxID=3110248 RepID=UPI002B21C9BF|nr:heterocyst frequency control protein PatD [Spirulina sp. 06S082]MEA5472173.1 heterocyst frequency control protein PatD [Spirulina sp. 06S082]
MEIQSLDSHYGIFLENLEAFKVFLESSPDGKSAIAERFTDLEQMYREKILILTVENGDRSIPKDIPETISQTISQHTSQWQSLHTETHRTMRLLQTDIIFLQASRKETTIQQRQAACLTKIEHLIAYCQQILTQLPK